MSLEIVVHSEKIRILFLAANPEGPSKLKLEKESREIERRIRESDYRDSLEFITKWAVRPEDLQQALLETKPHVLHFSGHGSNRQELVLEDTDGTPKPVSKTALQDLFRILKDNLAIVLLNACFSRPQAMAIVETVDVAVGMRKAVSDKSAIAFAGAFYRALGFGRNVEEAYLLGKNELMLNGEDDSQIPELLTRYGVNAKNVKLFEIPNEGGSENSKFHLQPAQVNAVIEDGLCGDEKEALSEPRKDKLKAHLLTGTLIGLFALAIFGSIYGNPFQPQGKQNGSLQNESTRVDFFAIRLSEDQSVNFGPINGDSPDGRVVYENERARLELLFDEPRYFMVVGLVPRQSSLNLIWPDNVSMDSQSSESFLFGKQLRTELLIDLSDSSPMPLLRKGTWRFTDGAGLHAFLIISSPDPLPRFDDVAKRLRTIPWCRGDVKPRHWKVVNSEAFIHEFSSGSLRAADESDDHDVQVYVDLVRGVFPGARIDGLVFNVEPEL